MFEAEKQEIIDYGCQMLDNGLIVGTWGNLSQRAADTGKMLVTPSGLGYRTLKPADIAVIDIESGKLVEGERKPSSESAMHLAIYRSRPDVMAAIHTHSTYATACAAARVGIPPLVEDLVQLAGGGIDVAEYAICGSDKLAENVVAALGEKNGVLLANHGAVGCGTNLHEAKIACELIEKAAKVFLLANSLPGGVKSIPADEVAIMHDFYLKHYRQR